MRQYVRNAYGDATTKRRFPKVVVTWECTVCGKGTRHVSSKCRGCRKSLDTSPLTGPETQRRER